MNRGSCAAGNALASRDAWWTGADSCKKFVKLPPIRYWAADPMRKAHPCAGGKGAQVQHGCKCHPAVSLHLLPEAASVQDVLLDVQAEFSVR